MVPSTSARPKTIESSKRGLEARPPGLPHIEFYSIPSPPLVEILLPREQQITLARRNFMRLKSAVYYASKH